MSVKKILLTILGSIVLSLGFSLFSATAAQAACNGSIPNSVYTTTPTKTGGGGTIKCSSPEQGVTIYAQPKDSVQNVSDITKNYNLRVDSYRRVATDTTTVTAVVDQPAVAYVAPVKEVKAVAAVAAKAAVYKDVVTKTCTTVKKKTTCTSKVTSVLVSPAVKAVKAVAYVAPVAEVKAKAATYKWDWSYSTSYTTVSQSGNVYWPDGGRASYSGTSYGPSPKSTNMGSGASGSASVVIGSTSASSCCGTVYFGSMSDSLTLTVPTIGTSSSYTLSDSPSFNIPVSANDGKLVFNYQDNYASGIVSGGSATLPLGSRWTRMNTCPRGNSWESTLAGWPDIIQSIGSIFNASTEYPTPYANNSGSWLPACKQSINQSLGHKIWSGVYETNTNPFAFAMVDYLPNQVYSTGTVYLANKGTHKAVVNLPSSPSDILAAAKSGSMAGVSKNQFYYKTGNSASATGSVSNYCSFGVGMWTGDCGKISQIAFDSSAAAGSYYGPEATSYLVKAGNTGFAAGDIDVGFAQPVAGYFYNLTCDTGATGATYDSFYYGGFLRGVAAWNDFSASNATYMLQNPNLPYNMSAAVHPPYMNYNLYDNIYPMSYTGLKSEFYRGFLPWSNASSSFPQNVFFDTQFGTRNISVAPVELRRGSNGGGAAADCVYPGDSGNWLNSSLSFKLKEYPQPKLGGTTVNFPQSTNNYLKVAEVTLNSTASLGLPYGWVDFSICPKSKWNGTSCSVSAPTLSSVRFYQKRGATVKFPSSLFNGTVSGSNSPNYLEGDYVAIARYNQSSDSTKKNRVYRSATATQDFTILPPAFSCSFPLNNLKNADGTTYKSFADMITINDVAPLTPGISSGAPTVQLIKNNAQIRIRMPGTTFNDLSTTNIFATPKPAAKAQNIGSLYFTLSGGTPTYNNGNIIIKDSTGKALPYGKWTLNNVANGPDGQSITGWMIKDIDFTKSASYTYYIGFKEASQVGQPLRVLSQYTTIGYAVTKDGERLGPAQGVWICETDGGSTSTSSTNTKGLPISLPIDVKRITGNG